MKFTTTLLALAATVSAHMEMSYPPPFKSKYNPFANGDIDYSNTSPLSADGSNYPCKGYQSLLGTSAGASVATFAPGQTGNITIVGGAYHNGGSCQISLSYDKGQTFTVIQSIQGECPLAAGGSFDFTIPADAPAGKDVLFAWSWFNEVGNREMYMNCASVTIGGGASKKREVEKRAAFSSRPGIFKANVGNGCGTEPGKDVQFPNPGPDVKNNGNNLAAPTGTCEASTGGSTGGDSGSGASASASTPAAAAPATSTPAVAPTSAAAPATSATRLVSLSPPYPADNTTLPSKSTGTGPESSPSSSLPGGVFITITTPSSAAATTPAAAPSTPAAVSTPAAAAPTAAPTSKPSTTTSASTPAGTGTSGSSTGGTAITPGTACTNEGAWNCVAGTSFQRCASGTWSVQMAMAAGTKCVPGLGDTLTWARRKGRSVRFAEARGQPWV
ncbi:hypothetical protein DL546_003866 [Coniochaeta pulveracea]|uniref:Chitin-binding type-4 domain-containing protein n=1 Tax=Coniochaeta pulveracea TaxID=177199 RepID=A0A420Y0R3_9PEZI|nr:hypothetical protein DL546_003866 [Coniochaeta pulveracea]